MDGARAAAAALRRPPTAARERYPEWTPVRTERRKPRRVGAGTRVDADGMREYAILQCVHGCGAELAMLSDGKQKIQVIEDHLAAPARSHARFTRSPSCVFVSIGLPKSKWGFYNS